MSAQTFDPYATVAEPSPRRFLHALNPLAKVAGVAPAMVVLIFVRDLVTPAAFLLLSLILIVVGARLTARSAALLFLALPVGMVAIALGFSLWVDPALVAHTPVVARIGDWTLFQGALAVGAATALRLGSIIALALIGGLTTTGPDLVRASVQQLRVPYRIGYTALAAFRFVPRFGHELSVIRAAHRVRGHHGGSGPFARLARGWGVHRAAAGGSDPACGACRSRHGLPRLRRARLATERHLVPFRLRDTVFIGCCLAASAAILVIFFPWQLP